MHFRTPRLRAMWRQKPLQLGGMRQDSPKFLLPSGCLWNPRCRVWICFTTFHSRNIQSASEVFFLWLPWQLAVWWCYPEYTSRQPRRPSLTDKREEVMPDCPTVKPEEVYIINLVPTVIFQHQTWLTWLFSDSVQPTTHPSRDIDHQDILTYEATLVEV